jgi:hypothetical protein
MALLLLISLQFMPLLLLLMILLMFQGLEQLVLDLLGLLLSFFLLLFAYLLGPF